MSNFTPQSTLSHTIFTVFGPTRHNDVVAFRWSEQYAPNAVRIVARSRKERDRALQVIRTSPDSFVVYAGQRYQGTGEHPVPYTPALPACPEELALTFHVEYIDAHWSGGPQIGVYLTTSTLQEWELACQAVGHLAREGRLALYSTIAGNHAGVTWCLSASDLLPDASPQKGLFAPFGTAKWEWPPRQFDEADGDRDKEEPERNVVWHNDRFALPTLATDSLPQASTSLTKLWRWVSSLLGRGREAKRQQQAQEDAVQAARLECSRLLRMEAEEQRARKQAEHDAAIDRLCNRISMMGITLRMHMGDDLDDEDLADLQQYQAEGAEHAFAVKKFGAACGYQFDDTI